MGALREIVSYLLFTVTALLAGWSTVVVYNRLPADWLCDYGEKPQGKHSPPRWKHEKLAVCLSSSGFFFFINILFNINKQQMVSGLLLLVMLWVGTQIFLADWHFMIIPDQWVGMLALTGFMLFLVDMQALAGGKTVSFHTTWHSPLAGLSVGALLLAAAWLLRLAAKVEFIGFGDIKLIFAIGVAVGAEFTVQILLLSFLASGTVFAVLLALGRLRRDEAKPLGPFLITVLSVHLLFREQCGELAGWLLTF